MADDINPIQPTTPLPVIHPVSDEDKPAQQDQHKKKQETNEEEEKPRPKEDDKGEFIDEYV
ncbi:hypothetical protein [Methylophaga thalassica]|uniref:hypothetical protein n=1 Tax=Methylophaga aminisulfidivorans TaxID=230105 RepID=UPI003A8D42C3